MTLDKDEWIRVGAGALFGVPFLSRAFLYRLHDIECSLLIRQDGDQIAPRVGNLAKVLEAMEMVSLDVGNGVVANGGRSLPGISIHYCPTSSSISFEGLASIPARRLSLSKCTSTTNMFGKIEFRLEPFQLVFSKRRLVAYAGLKDKNFVVKNSNNTIYGPISLTQWPDDIPIDKARMSCWKIRLNYIQENTRREITEGTNWSVAALDVTIEGKIKAMAYLESKDDRTRTPTVASSGS